MKIFRYFLFLIILLASSSGYCQKISKKNQQQYMMSKEEKKMLEDAEYLFGEKNYLRALPLYLKLEQSFPGGNNYVYRAGICYLYKSDEHEKALEYFLKIQKEEPDVKDYNFYLGRAYFLNYKYDEAIEQFNLFLKGKNNKEREKETLQLIENCKNGKKLIATPVEVKIENIGQPVNTDNSEYAPVISSDESVLIFTYRGEKSTGGLQNTENKPDPNGRYFEDIFISKKENGKWAEPVSIGNNINGNDHDACIALSNDGQKLFIYKNTIENKGDIFISRLNGETWSEPEWLNGDINSSFWDGSFSLSSDEKTVYFSSERPGGFGGRDIYTATLQKDGSWGDVKNLGESINTSFDDDAPFIHPDGKILHFSSKGHNSMGGYDIFRTDLNEDKTWSKPYNLGYPINTAGEDIYYVLSADGKRGYYSSGKSGGYGQQDIYVVEPGLIGKKVALVLVNGIVTVDDIPAKADITVVIKNENDKEQGKYNSNTATGKYLINFPAGSDYQLIYKIDGLEEQLRTINTASVDSFQDTIINVQFYTKNYQPKSGIVQDSVEHKAESESEVRVEQKVEVKKESEIKLPESGIPAPELKLTYENILKMLGDFTAEGLIYKVQIGAFQLPDNFNYQDILTFGKVEKQKYEDGITRFTIGSFKSLKEADDLKNKIIAKNITDAFVIAIYKGKRLSFKDLEAIKKRYNIK